MRQHFKPKKNFMKQKLTIFLTFLALASVAFAQKEKAVCTKTRMIGMHINALDVSTPEIWKANSGPKTLAGIKELDLGFSVSYWQSLCHNLDFSTKATVMFHNYAAVDRKVYSNKLNLVGVEIEPSINAKLYPQTNIFNAFATIGVGAGNYSNKYGAYVPTGFGLSACLSSTTTVMLQTQYRFSLTTDVLKDNVFHSIGIAQTMGKEKPAVVVPPPPPPVVDRDKDGVLDTDDKCPDVAGTEKYKGCPIPDTDADGLNDEQDKCPTIAGTAKYAGCPIPDTDGDGINDEQDKCPSEKGLARYQGCAIPDTDKDGVNDEEDKCPAVAGPASNMGCPEIEKAVIEKVNFAAKSIQYGTGSAKILPSSFKSLNELVTLLNGDNSLMIDIAGHSDTEGNAERNKALSQERSESVKKYFMSKGIAEGRITAAGFGSERPIADNKTAAGRAKNRRTELTVRNH